MQQDVSRNTVQRIIFSSKTNCALVEQIMRNSFPLYPTASSRDSGLSYTDVQGSESSESRPASYQSEMELQNGTESFQNGIQCVQNGMQSLECRGGENSEKHKHLPTCSQADRRCSKKDDTHEESELKNENLAELAGETLDPNLEESPSRESRSHLSMPSPPLITSKNVIGSRIWESLDCLDQAESSLSPIHSRFSCSSNLSEDLVLNPDRTETEV